jgi:uncharacterized SAM-binding protein YcdF (DUF218 family)
MSTYWLITNALSSLLLPPTLFVVVGISGLLIARRYPYLGRTVIVLSITLLLALSTDAGSAWLIRPLEQQSLQAKLIEKNKSQAIVVLGGGRARVASGEGDYDQVGPITLMRLRAAARLQRQTHVPLLVSGGAPDGQAESEAVLMARSLKDDFGVTARWVESNSINTNQNAILSAQLLRQDNIQQILLVTDAIHMPRARWAFEHAGLRVAPVPSHFVASDDFQLASFIPNAQSLKNSHYAIHEWLGLLVYRLRYAVAD